MHDPTKAPVIRLTRIAEVHTLEVMETDVERIDALYAEESQALGFASVCLGVFATVAVSWLAATHLGPAALGIHGAALGVSGLGTLWFGATWVRARRARPRLLQQLTRGSLRAVRPDVG